MSTSTTAQMEESQPTQNETDAKAFTFPLESHRDFRRMNRACATLQANVYSLLSKESLQSLKNHCVNKKRKMISEDDYDAVTTLLDLALDTTDQSMHLFNKCQRTVSKVIAERYSSAQHNLLLRSSKFGEKATDNEALAPCVTTPDIETKYNTLVNAEDSFENSNQPRPSSPPPENPYPLTDIRESRLESFLSSYCSSVLGPVPQDAKYHTPYEIASVLGTCDNGDLKLEKKNYINLHSNLFHD